MSGYQILVVDDSPEIHAVIGAYLRVSGYDVVHAKNGLEALDILNEHTPDLVLLDIQMPELDGFDTLERIKKQPRQAEVPVLFLSSLDKPNLKVKGLQMGAEDYIVKPFNRAELIARVNVCLRRGEKYRKLESRFGGNLGQVSVAEVLQTMDLGKKSGRVDFPDMDAAIEVGNRHVLRARWHGFEGKAALHRILLLENGRFTVNFTVEVNSSGESLDTIQSILLSSMVYLDETRGILGDHLKLGDLLKPGSQRSAEELKELGLSVWPASVAEVIAQMTDGLKENAAILVEAETNDIVTLVDQRKGKI